MSVSVQPVKLTTGQLNNLLQAEHALSTVLTDYDKAEQCGADCQEVRLLVQEAIQRSQQIRRHFGPTQ